MTASEKERSGQPVTGAEQRPLVIEVRGNEFAAAAPNPHVPLGADAIVRDALECAAAGAAGYHWHARGADGADRPDDLELHRAVARGLRGSGLILHPSLGFTATQGDAASRLRTVLALNADPATAVDLVPVDLGAAVFDVWDPVLPGFSTDNRVLLNTTGYLKELLTALRSQDVRVLAVVWSPGAVRTTLRLRETGLLPRPTFWELGFTGPAVPGGPPATQTGLAAYLEQLPADEPWTAHVRDGQGLEMAEWAIARGGHVSIGLGDDPYENLGLPRNAALVRAVVGLAGQYGRPVAGPAAARALLQFS